MAKYTPILSMCINDGEWEAAALSDWDLRVALAERLGWKLVHYDDDRPAKSEKDYADAQNDGWTWDGRMIQAEAWAFNPFVNASDDLEVLEYVRLRWTSRQIRAFSIVLFRILDGREWCLTAIHGPLSYKLGDYARAALGAQVSVHWPRGGVYEQPS